MAQDAEIVILGEDGTEHVFPPGFDPKRAAAIVRGQSPTAGLSQLNAELTRMRGASAPDELTRIRPIPGRVDAAIDALPAAGGAAGGAIGGVGGTAFGFGVGGVPGAVGGATIGGAGGEALRQLVNLLRGKPSPTSATDAATTIAGQGALQGGLEATGQVAMRGLVKGGEAVYRGYLKPSLAKVNLSKATQIVRTAIDENLPMTSAGLTRAGDVIGQLKAKVDDVLASAPGQTIDLHAVANDVRTWAKQMYDRAGRDPNDYQAVLKVADRIDGHPSLGAPVAGQIGPQLPTVDLPAANTVKRDLQASAADKFGLPNASAEVAGEKYASSAMRRGIEQQVPAVGPINLRESKLIDTARALARATGRDANRDKLIGTRAVVGGLVGGTLAGGGAHERGVSSSETAMMTAVGSLVGTMSLSPAIATRAAILAVKLGERVPGTVPADAARAAVQAVLEMQKQRQ